MDCNIGIEDVGLAVLQELWNKVALQAVELVSDARDVVLEKRSFQEFSRTISLLSNLLKVLKGKKVEAAIGVEATKSILQSLHSQLEKAHKVIKDYKCKSRLRLLLQSQTMLKQMQDLAREIASTVSTFQMVNLDTALNLRSKTDQVVENLRSMEFQSAIAKDNITSQIQDSVTMNGRGHENAMNLLKKIAKAVGAEANASLVKKELELLKQEKEEMGELKKQAEVLYINQLMQLLYDTEIVKRPADEEITLVDQQYPIDSFICSLCNEMMTDPVATQCGDIFERKAIQEYFQRGGKTCPTCRVELQSLELAPNRSLKSSIEEWKQRELDLKFKAAISDINCNDIFRKNKALEEIQLMLQISKYTAQAGGGGLSTKLVELLKDDRLNTAAALKCLYYLAKHSDQQKEAMVEAGAIRRIVKQIYKGETESAALDVLLELSEREVFGEKIGHYKNSIPLLVSLVNSREPYVSQKASSLLQNISFNVDFVVKMAESGCFGPFVTRFNQGPPKVREQMTAAIINMELTGNSIEEIKDKQFILNLVQMLSPSSPACKLTCLKSIKKLLALVEMVNCLLAENSTIPLLLGIICNDRPNPHLQQEAAACLALLIKCCHDPEFQSHNGFQELQSEGAVGTFLQLARSSDPQTRVQFLQLVVELSRMSDAARELIKLDKDAITQLYSFLESGQPAVRLRAMKLIYCISEDRSGGCPLPTSPAKETAVSVLAGILKSSPNTEERSIAAGIISQLPSDDILIDNILCKSGALKAIHEVICSIDDELNGINAPASISTSLLENALSALLRYTEPTKPELQRQVGDLELYPSLVRVLSNGSSRAKKQTAIALAKLSQSTSLCVSDAAIMENQASSSTSLLHITKLLPSMSWCFSSTKYENICSVHGTACSPRHTFCLVKTGALKPLLQSLRETEPGVAEAALMALETLLADEGTLSCATAAIVENQGVEAILQVLEKGPLSAKDKALDIFQKILMHAQINSTMFQKSERVVIQLLQEDAVKKKAAEVLKQMKSIPDQFSYF